MEAIVAIGITVIALFIIGMIVKKSALAIFIVVQNIKFSAKSKVKKKRDKAAWMVRVNREASIKKEHEDKLEVLRKKGYSIISGDHCEMGLERDKNERIKALYDLDGNRIPLANLAKVWGSKVIGNDPVLVYCGEVITAYRMLQDEREIGKISNNNGV